MTQVYQHIVMDFVLCASACRFYASNLKLDSFKKPFEPLE